MGEEDIVFRNGKSAQICSQLFGDWFVDVPGGVSRAKKGELTGVGSNIVLRSSPAIACSISRSRFLHSTMSFDAPSFPRTSRAPEASEVASSRHTCRYQI